LKYFFVDEANKYFFVARSDLNGGADVGIDQPAPAIVKDPLFVTTLNAIPENDSEAT
jgi:hypothetical protein